MNQYPCDKHTLYLSQQAKEKKKQQQQQKTNVDHCKQQGTVGKHTKTTTQSTQLPQQQEHPFINGVLQTPSLAARSSAVHKIHVRQGWDDQVQY